MKKQHIQKHKEKINLKQIIMKVTPFLKYLLMLEKHMKLVKSLTHNL